MPKKMPKKPRVMSQKQKQRQSVNVTINQDRPIRRRGPNKPKAPSGQGQGQSPGQGPTIQYAPYQMTNAAPQSNQQEFAAEVARQVIKQSVPNIVTQIPDNFKENQKFYKSPFRFRPFSADLNIEKMQPENLPLNNFQPSPSPPNPVLPDIVEEQNKIDQRSVSQDSIPISSASPVPEGFSSNQSINQLADLLQQKLMVYDDLPEDSSRSGQMSPITPNTPIAVGIPIDVEIPTAQLLSSNKGRPFTKPSNEDLNAIDLYLTLQQQSPADRKRILAFNNRKEEYKRGNRLLSQNKSNNPYIIEFANAVRMRLSESSKGK